MKKTALWNWLNRGVLLDNVVENHRQNNFDLTRLLAALVVICIHCINFSTHKYLRFLGALGVPAFFFLSGLLVSASFYRSSSWKNFAWKRIVRIYPAAIVVILLCALLIGPVITTFSLREYFTNPIFYRNIMSVFLVQEHGELPGVFTNSVLQTPTMNASLWTIPLELKMYLFVLLYACIRFPFKNLLLICITLALIFPVNMYGSTIDAFLQHKLHPTFTVSPYVDAVPLFLLGMLCNAYKEKIVLRNYWLFLLIPAFFISVELAIFSYCTHLLVAALVLHFGSFGTSWLKRLTPKADYSYGLYLFAFPVEQIMANYVVQPANPYVLFAYIVAVTFVCAFFSWHVIEKKALRYKGLVK